MAKRNRSTTEKKYETWIKEGRGQGQGPQYKPWLTIHDVPSEGVSSRGKGWKTKRLHHTLSTLELNYLYILEWEPNVVDIREQYPLLPLKRTLEIAAQLGVKHPTDPKTDEPVVMTTDFLIDFKTENGIELWPRQIKPESKLTMDQIHKFRIEQQFYAEVGIDNWGVVTDKDIPKAFSKNIEDLHEYFYINQFWNPEKDVIYQVAEQLFWQYTSSSAPLSKIAFQLDKTLGFENGTCLMVAKHMISRKLWVTDMDKQIRYSRRIDLKECTPSSGIQGEMA